MKKSKNTPIQETPDEKTMIERLQIPEDSFFETIRIENEDSNDGYDYYIVSATPDGDSCRRYTIDLYKPYIKENGWILKEIPLRCKLDHVITSENNHYYDCRITHKNHKLSYTRELLTFVDALASLCLIGSVRFNEHPTPSLTATLAPLGYTPNREGSGYINNKPQSFFYEDYLREVYNQATQPQSASERI